MAKRDQRKTLVRVGLLLDDCQLCPKHVHIPGGAAEVEKRCGGCSVFEELRNLGSSLEDRKPKDKYQHILDKGQDMTKSEIEFLLSCDVPKTSIRKALQMNSIDFVELMVHFGLGKRRVKEVEQVAVENVEVKQVPVVKEDASNLTYENYQALKSQGLKDVEIAKKLGVPTRKIANWKYLNKQLFEDPESAGSVKVEKEKPVQDLKGNSQDNIWKEKYTVLAADYEALAEKAGQMEKELKLEIAQLSSQIDDLKNSQDAIHCACDDVEDELLQLRVERDRLLNQSYDNDYLIENLKSETKKLKNEFDRVDIERWTLRELVKLWI